MTSRGWEREGLGVVNRWTEVKVRLKNSVLIPSAAAKPQVSWLHVLVPGFVGRFNASMNLTSNLLVRPRSPIMTR